MAIKPEECTAMEVKETRKLAELEGYIDIKLKAEYIKGHTVTIHIDKPSNRVFNELRDRYTRCGWFIESTSCPSMRNEPPTMKLDFKASK